MDKRCACENCDWTGPESELDPLEENGIFDIVAPGEDMPNGRCPKCGAVAHEAKPPIPADIAALLHTQRATAKLLRESRAGYDPSWSDHMEAVADALEAATRPIGEPYGYVYRLRYGPDRWSHQLMFSEAVNFAQLPPEDVKEVTRLYAEPRALSGEPQTPHAGAIEDAKRAVERLTRCLARPDWKPDRAHIESARNVLLAVSLTSNL